MDFLWRLARAYGDLFEMTTDAEEKRKYVTDGEQRKNIYVESECRETCFELWLTFPI